VGIGSLKLEVGRGDQDKELEAGSWKLKGRIKIKSWKLEAQRKNQEK
jgi:hypothetical protein